MLFRSLHDVFDLLPAAAPAAAGPPAGVVLARTNELPVPLRRFRAREEMAASPVAADNSFEIAFPPDGATVELAAADDGTTPLSLRARGGRKPLRWLIDGRPIPVSPFKRGAAWTDAAEGRVRITALDADGHAASAEVWISRAP